MRSHTQSVVTEPNRRRITGSISYKPLISDISVLMVCNKTGGTIKGDIKKNLYNLVPFPLHEVHFTRTSFRELLLLPSSDECRHKQFCSPFSVYLYWYSHFKRWNKTNVNVDSLPNAFCYFLGIQFDNSLSNVKVKVKVNQSCYKPGVGHRVPGS